MKLTHINSAACTTSKRKTAYQELEPIEDNPNYDFNYQQATHLPHEITVLPVRACICLLNALTI